MKTASYLLTMLSLLCCCTAQVQMKTNPGIQVNIDNPNTGVPAQLGRLPHGRTQYGNLLFGTCDRNDVLMDVLKNIADTGFIQQEVEYETKNKLDDEALYNRRMAIIKGFVTKK